MVPRFYGKVGEVQRPGRQGRNERLGPAAARVKAGGDRIPEREGAAAGGGDREGARR